MNKQASFKQLIKKEFVRSALIPIIIIELMLLILYFSINAYKTYRTRITLLQEVKLNIGEIASREAGNINMELSKISGYANLIKRENERFFKDPSKFTLPDVKPVLKVAPNGTMYKENNNGGGSIYYSGLTKFGSEQFKKAEMTEAFDPLFKAVVDIDSNAVAVYINTWDNMNRYYPFIDKTYEQYMPNMDITSYNFYYLADAKHNPSRQVVWTDAYLDPAGMGWMASCIIPVYKENFLEGVVGIDVTIEKFTQNILALKIPWQGSAFLVDEAGTILAMPESVEKLLGLSELKKHIYNNAIKENTYKPEDFNLLKNSSIPDGLKAVVKENRAIEEVLLGGHHYIVSQNRIKETGWRFLTLIDKEVVLAPVNHLTYQSNMLGYGAILFLILFYLPFFIYLIRKAESISGKISSPIEYLIDTTRDISRKFQSTNLEHVGLLELDELADNFNVMTKKLNEVYQEQEEKISEGVKQLREKDHMIIKQSRQAAMGEMIGNIAHQWRQPLNSIGVIVQNIEDAYNYDELTKEYMVEKINNVMTLLSYMSHTIDDFRNFFKPDKEKQSFSIAESVRSSLSFMDANFSHNNIKVDVDVVEDIKIWGYPNEYAQVLLNILNNARDIIKEREIKYGEIKIRVNASYSRSVVEIEDNGGGIRPDVIEKIFEPYFTTKEMGTGLGLYMSKMIVEKNMGGELKVENRGDGAVFTLLI
ncbi:MAG: sensor histidine kinase [Sphingobacteriia bacterium]|nr:sensor histidine kinase [Sphingobacteriia bacterium]